MRCTISRALRAATRAWAARITGERGYPIRDAMKRLSKLATDPEPAVRLEVATAARRFVSGSLMLDTPAFVPLKEVITAGEQLQVSSAVIEFFARLTDCTLNNHYGPTESHVVTAFVLYGNSVVLG